ncbi:MAG TPA: hypothetical protein VD927_04775 [Chryseosolibacter sp.]|nr:hypothetical protein [Chryseosolibacter sp.]
MNESKYSDTYTPVSYDHRETIQEQMDLGKSGKVFFMNKPRVVESAEGKITWFGEIPGQGLFIKLDNGLDIRIDKIITIFGKPGAAYDEYEAYGNVCLDCTGGYDL